MNPKIVGLTINGIDVLDMDTLERFIREEEVSIAYICTNQAGAQEVADKLVNCGVKAIWNFAPIDLKVPDDIIVENVHLIDNLLTLSYFLKDANEELEA